MDTWRIIEGRHALVLLHFGAPDLVWDTPIVDMMLDIWAGSTMKQIISKTEIKVG